MQISFGRALPVHSDTNSKSFISHKPDPTTEAFINTIRNRKVSYLDKETSGMIGEFLKAQIKDYSPRTGIYTRRIDGNIYLFTGKEATKAKYANRGAFEEILELEEYYTKKQINPLEDEGYKRQRAIIERNRDNYMLSMVENGEDGKPNSYIEFKKNGIGQIDTINYSEDGFVESLNF